MYKVAHDLEGNRKAWRAKVTIKTEKLAKMLEEAPTDKVVGAGYAVRKQMVKVRSLVTAGPACGRERPASRRRAARTR